MLLIRNTSPVMSGKKHFVPLISLLWNFCILASAIDITAAQFLFVRSLLHNKRPILDQVYCTHWDKIKKRTMKILKKFKKRIVNSSS